MLNKKENTVLEGPLLLAANHPNSFFDAILMGVLFRKNLFFLARGDAFASPRISKILRTLHILPVYRLSEGANNLGKNYETFDSCIEIFKENEIVLIFSEGLCRNEWKIRPLKKGTARLSMQAWDAGINLRVLPVSINYSSFRRSGLNVFVNFGNIISQEDIDMTQSDGKKLLQFNELLMDELQKNAIVIPENNTELVNRKFHLPLNVWMKYLLMLPATIGAILHAPFYLPVKWTASKLFSKEPVHFNSIQFVLLFLFYPLTLLFSIIMAILHFNSAWPLSLFFVLPFSAWAFQQVKSTSA